jgi:beta-lactamase regulating signal transducer with metallopeptidase domain
MKPSIILLAGLAAAACLRTRSAAVRHWILATAIVCAGATPLLQRAMPEWPVNLAGAATAISPSPVTVEVSVAETSRSVPESQPRASAGATDWLLALWMIGAAISLSALAAGIGRLAWLTARASRASGRWAAYAAQICAQHGLRRKVDLLQSGHPSLLATWGVLRPRIIFPAAASDWPDDLVRVILHHEIAHIRRCDWLTQIAGELLRAVYWFNPLAWLACRRLRVESEQACDDEVLRAGTEGAAYAEHLLMLARHFSERRTWFPAPAMARRSTLHRRITAMLNPKIDRRPLASAGRLGTVALLLAFTMAIAAAQTSSTFSGTLLDPQGGVLPGVRVTLTNSDGQTLETNTNASGQFQLTAVPPGDYALAAQLPGFKAYKRNVTVASTNVVQTIVLELGQVQETINVVDGGESVVPMARVAPGPSTPACGQQPPIGDFAQRETDLQRVRVGGNLRAPVKLKDVRPLYPASLRGTDASAEVVLDAVIGVDGFVHDIRARDGSQPAFVDAMITAVTQWEFRATLLNCVPVEVAITITGRFAPQR